MVSVNKCSIWSCSILTYISENNIVVSTIARQWPKLTQVTKIFYTVIAQRITGAVVRVGYYEDSKQNLRCGQKIRYEISHRTRIARGCGVPILGRYVSIQLDDNDHGLLQLCEVQVFGEGGYTPIL